jgi:putative restriction endonuclease
VAFGELPGFPPGSLFEDRHALAVSGVHRPPQAGICGRAEEGAESIVLSGGFVDDIDRGDEILYTGQGGRDPTSGRQVGPQRLSRGNLALANSLRHGLPVRVIRRVDGGGYRYDGLYRVEDYGPDIGEDGFLIWRFKLVALETSLMQERVRELPGLYEVARRCDVIISRVIRDTAVTRSVKRLYDYRCQVCGVQLDTPPGPYAEAAHIRPLGRPHDGPDALENVLCLCPNHHVLFDRWQLSLTDDLALIGERGRLYTHRHHVIAVANVRYHRARYEAAHAA